MVTRLVTGILAVTFLPLGVVFVLIGLLADDVDRGTPEGFLYAAFPLLAVACDLTIRFAPAGEVTTSVFVPFGSVPQPGTPLPVAYDPAEPANVGVLA